jgi:hypothetical protein
MPVRKSHFLPVQSKSLPQDGWQAETVGLPFESTSAPQTMSDLAFRRAQGRLVHPKQKLIFLAVSRRTKVLVNGLALRIRHPLSLMPPG